MSGMVEMFQVSLYSATKCVIQYFCIIGRPCKIKNSPDYVPSIFKKSSKNDQQPISEDDPQATQLPSQDNLRKYERLQNRRLKQSTHNNVLKSKEVSKRANKEASFEQPDLETAGSSSSITQSMPGNEVVELGDVTQETIAPEIADKELEDVPEVVNLDFTDSTDEMVANMEEDIPDCSTATLVANSEEDLPDCSTATLVANTEEDIRDCSTTTLPVVDYHQHASLKTVADKGVGTEDNFESREELLEKLRHQQWLFSLVKAELDAKYISTSPSRMLENDDKRTHYFTGLPSTAAFSKMASKRDIKKNIAFVFQTTVFTSYMYNRLLRNFYSTPNISYSQVSNLF